MGFVATGSCISRVKHDDSGRYRQFDMGIESRQRLFQHRRLGVVPYPQNAPDFLWRGIQQAGELGFADVLLEHFIVQQHFHAHE